MQSANGRLHLALLVALVAVGAGFIAFPLTSSGARADEPRSTLVEAVSGESSATHHSQAQTVVRALTNRENDALSMRTAQSADGRLYLALLVALVAAGVGFIAFPMTRSDARADEPRSTPVEAASGESSATYHSQAQTVVRALTKREYDAPSMRIVQSANGRLHLALVVALVAVGAGFIAFPLTSSGARADEPRSTPVEAVSGGLSAGLHSQAQAVVRALTQVEPTASAPSDVTQSLEGVPAGNLIPRSLLSTAANIFLQGALAGPEGQQGLFIQTQPAVRLTIHDGGVSSEVFSTRATVGDALRALGTNYAGHDVILPAPDTPLTAGLHVYVRRATLVNLHVGGESPAQVYTHAESVGGLLSERGVELAPGNSVSPALATRLRNGLSIRVTIVTRSTDVEETRIPFETVYHNDSSLLRGEERLVQAGQDGLHRLEYEVVYKNGKEISRELISETTLPPTYHVIARGTKAPAPAPAPAPAASASEGDCSGHTLTVWATWYTAASAGGSGVTATGTAVRKGTVAVDPNVIPLGTSMYIPGYGYGTAEDTGGGIIGHKIDLGYGPSDVKDWRTGWVTICILG